MITGCGSGDMELWLIKAYGDSQKNMVVFKDNKKAWCRLAVGMKEDSTILVGLYVKEKDSYTNAAKRALKNHLEQEDEGTGNRRTGEVMKSGEIESH